MEDRSETILLEKTANHNDATSEKERAILEACRWRNLGDLRALAESPGGFLTDEIRQQACE